jgi:hypothetical protein
MAAQARNDVVYVVDSENYPAYARVRRRAFRLGSHRRRRVEFRQFNPAVSVRGPHRGDVGTDVVEPDDLIHPRALDPGLAFQLHTESTKNALAASRSSTTMRTLSIRSMEDVGLITRWRRGWDSNPRRTLPPLPA